MKTTISDVLISAGFAASNHEKNDRIVAVDHAGADPVLIHVVDGFVRLQHGPGDLDVFGGPRTVLISGPRHWSCLDVLVKGSNILECSATQDCRVIKVPIDWVRRKAPNEVLQDLANKSADAWSFSGMTIVLNSKPVRLRVLNYLTDLANTYPEIEISLSQEDLAGLVGAERSTVNKALKALQAEGLVTLDYGMMTIADMKRLRNAFRSEMSR